jgi:hypothetical protein
MVPGPEDVETNGPKNKTRLVAARPPGRLPAVGRGVADFVASASVQALKLLTEMILSHNPTLMVKEQGPRRKTA